ncbi:hypothetical protein B0H14DRAFT_3751753 [Mycena olivaceomarginata]|nr:hypothetical protein B0H14DRAFT_3751753 [Mycena olivaceomarginata]
MVLSAVDAGSECVVGVIRSKKSTLKTQPLSIGRQRPDEDILDVLVLYCPSHHSNHIGFVSDVAEELVKIIPGCAGEPQLAENIPADFPDLAVMDLYRSPVISELEVGRSLDFHPPRLDILARFAEDHFGWGDSVGILTHFADQLFAGLVVRELVLRASAADDLVTLTRSPSLIKSIVGERRHKTTGHLAELRLMLNLDPDILKSALQAITGRLRVWVPQSMVEHIYPHIILDYISKSKPVRKTKKTRQDNVRDHTPATSNLATANPKGRAMYLGHVEQQDSLFGKAAGPPAYPEKRYTAMSVTHQGQKVLELITDSEGEY